MFLKERGTSGKGCSLEHTQFLSVVCVVSHLTYDHHKHLNWQKLLISFCTSLPYDSINASVVVQ